MKFLVKIFFLICLILGSSVKAEPFKVLVLPVDLFTVCENYYCFEEPSEIFANDIISEFNRNNKISSTNLYDVRKTISANQTLKPLATSALHKYKVTHGVDFASLKKISQAFNSNSILLISSSVVQNSQKHDIWEIMEVASVFELYNSYTLETRMVLLDNVNDVVMWSGSYKKHLGDNETRFWAKSMAQAVSRLEKIRFYSRDIVSPTVVQNVTGRFYQKSIKEIKPVKTTSPSDFRPNPFANGGMLPEDDVKNDDKEIESETIYSF